MVRIKRGKHGGLILVGGVVGALLLPLVIFGLVMIFHHPYQRGEPVAAMDIESGTPFELRFTSDGQAQRIWLDMECDRCSLPVEGSLAATAGGQVVEEVEIAAGEDDLGDHKQLIEQLLIEIPEQPAGVEVTVRGTLTVNQLRGTFSNQLREDAPPPVVRSLRLSIAP